MTIRRRLLSSAAGLLLLSACAGLPDAAPAQSEPASVPEETPASEESRQAPAESQPPERSASAVDSSSGIGGTGETVLPSETAPGRTPGIPDEPDDGDEDSFRAVTDASEPIADEHRREPSDGGKPAAVPEAKPDEIPDSGPDKVIPEKPTVEPVMDDGDDVPTAANAGDASAAPPNLPEVPPPASETVNPLLEDARPLMPSVQPNPEPTIPRTPVQENSPAPSRAAGAPTATVAPSAPAVQRETDGGADLSIAPADRTEPVESPLEDRLDDPVEHAASPTRWLGGPGEFSILLDGAGWVFRSDLSTSGAWRFLSRKREGDSTRFDFLFEEAGAWNLVFERQDLSSGGAEREIRNVRVGEDGGPVVMNGPLGSDSSGAVSGDIPSSPAERDEAARRALEAGRPDDAIAFWEKDAHRKDDEGRRARAAIMEEASNAGALIPLVTWLPSYLEDGADPSVLAEALEVLETNAGYGIQETWILADLAGNVSDPRQPEWLYRLARKLEEPGEGRNLDRAAALYRQVVAGWPLTDWRDKSEERLLWLQRHYFRVR